jgi:hypothetical protein
VGSRHKVVVVVAIRPRSARRIPTCRPVRSNSGSEPYILKSKTAGLQPPFCLSHLAALAHDASMVSGLRRPSRANSLFKALT